MLSNLKEETEQFIQNVMDDVKEVLYSYKENGEVKTGKTTIEQFLEIASKINYDCGWGSQIISDSLILVFESGSIAKRHEYDGAEYWEFVSLPKNPKERDITLRDFYIDEEEYICHTFGYNSKEHDEWERREYGEDE